MHVLDYNHLYKYLATIFNLTPKTVYVKIENNILGCKNIIDKFIDHNLICEAAIFAKNLKFWKMHISYIWDNTSDAILLKSFTSSILMAKTNILSMSSICNRQIISSKLFVVNSGRFLKILFMALEDDYDLYKSLNIVDFILFDIINGDLIDDALSDIEEVISALYIYNNCIGDLEYLFGNLKSDILKNIYLLKFSEVKNNFNSIENVLITA